MPKLIDLTGQTYNELTILYRDKINTSDGKPKWICQCSCGKICSIAGKDIRNGHTKSCGHLQKEKVKQLQFKDLTGQQFGYLKVIKDDGTRTDQGKIKWLCQCLNCGSYIHIPTTSLTCSGTQSCGCINSFGEINIAKILTENNIIFEKEKTFNDFKFDTQRYARYDFYLPEYNRLIEFDGKQHFQDQIDNSGWNKEDNFKITSKHDQIKNNYAKEHNIPLVRIPYWERDNITLDMIMGDQYLIKEE